MGEGLLSVTGGWPWESRRAPGGLRVGGLLSWPLLYLFSNIGVIAMLLRLLTNTIVCVVLDRVGFWVYA